MAKITRSTQKIFGADSINEITVFGTAKTDNPVYTKNVDSLQGGEAYADGWSAAVQADYAPYMEDTNGFMYMVTSQLAYILQQGAAIEYDANTSYYKGSIVAAADGSGTWYKSIYNGENKGKALSNTTYWQQIQLAKNGTPLFSQITTDFVLSGDDAIGWAMQGSNVTNATYPTAYSKILALYNAGTAVTYRGITAKRASDGRYIADISQQSAINTLFGSTGIADFYIIDTTGQSFYLPKTARFIQYTTDTSLLNQFNDSGLPSLNQTITATVPSSGAHKHTVESNGNHYHGAMGDQSEYGSLYGFYNSSNNHKGSHGGVDNDNTIWKTSTNGNHTHTINTGAAHTHTVNVTNTIGNQVYGRATIVQPPSSLKLLYYRVGDTAV